jgi:hypothetical protein
MKISLTPSLGLGARRLHLLALADVGGEGDDLAAVLRLQPFQDDRGVEAAGIGEHHLFDGPPYDRPRQKAAQVYPLQHAGKHSTSSFADGPILCVSIAASTPRLADCLWTR